MVVVAQKQSNQDKADTVEAKKNTQVSAEELQQQLHQLQQELQQCSERERRALADYQNVLRRSQEERAKLIALANADLMQSLLQPLDHLELAARQLQDKGLDMVLAQFKGTLTQFGLEPIAVEGKKFDIETMEAVERKSPEGETVVEVRATGYTLNGQVIRHAKVVVG